MNMNVQTKTTTMSTTKLAVAFAFLGAAALAAAAASMPTGKLAGSYGYGYDQPPATPLVKEQPDIRRFDMQIAPDKAVFITNSFAYQNLAFDPTLNFNAFNKTGAGTVATLQVTQESYAGQTPVSYGYGVVYNQFPIPKFNGEINPFEIEVLNKGVITWSSQSRVKLPLDPVLSKTGYMTFFVLVKNADGVHMIPEVAADDITYIVMKNTAGSSETAPTSTVAITKVLIEPAYDATAADRILTPSTGSVQVGRWKMVAQNGSANVSLLTFQLLDQNNKLVTDSKDFGVFSLYNAENMTTPIAVSTYQSGRGLGIVQFSVPTKVTLQKDKPMYLVLKASVNGSGLMKPGAIRTWNLRVTAPSSISLMDDVTGTQLTNAQMILVSSTGATAPGSVFNNAYYLLHNAAPTITAVNSDYKLSLSENAQVLKFMVTNPGDRDLKLRSTAVRLHASGLTANLTTATGSISNFKIFEVDQNGNLLQQVGVPTENCVLAAGLHIVGLNSDCYAVSTWGSALKEMKFNFAANVSVAPGAARTFVVTANTTRMFEGKKSGSVGLIGTLDGDTGFDRGVKLWRSGPLVYSYTSVTANSVTGEQGPFVQSDSYDVQGNYLSKSL